MTRVLKIEAERWPKVCLREEARNILNKMPTAWGKEIIETLGKETAEGAIVTISTRAAKKVLFRRELRRRHYFGSSSEEGAISARAPKKALSRREVGGMPTPVLRGNIIAERYSQITTSQITNTRFI